MVTRIISAESVGKSFNGFRVFNGIDFAVSTGKSLAITGPNGSGKSTLLEIAGGIKKPSSGSIRFIRGSETLSRDQFIADIGLVSPRTNPYRELTGRENIGFIACPRSVSAENTDRLVALFNLTRHINRPVKHYSTGMKQRLAIICALLHDPPVLLFDEPASNLDADGRTRLYEYIETVRDRKILIIATNDAEEASLCRTRIDLA